LIGQGLGPDEPIREDLALGSLWAGFASGLAGFAVHHAVCQTIVRLCGTPHAQTNAVMLPHFVRFMESGAPDAIASVGAALGAEPADGAGADAVAALASRSGVTTLGELRVAPEQLEGVTAAALEHPALFNTPRPPGHAELLAVLQRAL
jgi:alcohol dehydrogenase class IV